MTESSIPGISVGLSTLGPEEIRHRFGFHRITTDGEEATLPLHQELHGAAIEYAEYLDSILPDGREKDIALERLEESASWAHKALANGESVIEPPEEE